MFAKIVGTIIIIMAVVSVVMMFSFGGLSVIAGSPGLVSGLTLFAFMIPARIRAGSLTEEMAK